MSPKIPIDFDGAVIKILQAEKEAQARGTGFFISETFRELRANVYSWAAYFMTCYHVVGDNPTVWVTWAGLPKPVLGEQIAEWSDSRSDFAVYKVPLEAAHRTLRVEARWRPGDRVFTKGFQYGRFEGHPASGVIIGDTIKDGIRLLVLGDATHVQPGVSGAPAWNEREEAVVGMVTEKWEKTNTAFIIPLREIGAALATRTDSPELRRIIRLAATVQGSDQLPKPLRRPASPRYYMYVSDKKLEMLWPQLRSDEVERVATELGIDSPNSETEVVSGRDAQLRILERHFEDAGDIGTVDSPREYIRGEMVASIGLLKGRSVVFGFGGGSYVYFGGIEARKAVALIGSPQHLVGRVGDWKDIESRGAYAYLLPAIMDVLRQDTPTSDDRDLRYYINWINQDIGMAGQPISYLAKVMIRSDGSILATPLYVTI